MDFDFLDQSHALQRRPTVQQGTESSERAVGQQQGGLPGGQQQHASSRSSTIDIPSYQQVHSAQQQRAAVPNFFRPGSSADAAKQQQEQQDRRGRQQQAAWPAAGGGGSSGTSSSAAHQQPWHQHQHQHQQPWQQHQQPPLQQQQQPQQPLQQHAQGAAHLLVPMAIPQHFQGAAPPGLAMAGPSSSFARPAAGPQPMQTMGLPLQPGTAGLARPAPAAAPIPASAILVSRRQQGNPLLKHVKQVRWQYADIVPDYMVGANTALLFLSIRYHLLHPDYILRRLKELQHSFRVLLLVHVDVEDMVRPLGDITKAAVLNDATLICAWSNEECARWLETLKSYESKSATNIQEHVESDYASRLAAALSCVRSVNRTDAATLGSNMGSLADILRAPMEKLTSVPGIGPTKVRRLFEAFHEPFRKQPKPASATAHSTAGAAAVATDMQGSAAQGTPQQPAVLDAAALQASSSAHVAGSSVDAGQDEEQDDVIDEDEDEEQELTLALAPSQVADLMRGEADEDEEGLDEYDSGAEF